MSEERWRGLIGWFVDRPFIVGMAALMLALAGLYVAPFDWELGGAPRDPVPVDAIPDIGENQQIVFTEWMGRSPRDVEDQISYPLTTALLGIPGVRTIRSSSAFGFSTIYIIFEDDIDFYWSRSRVLEKLASLPPGTVPDGVTPTLGPGFGDDTGLGDLLLETFVSPSEPLPSAIGVSIWGVGGDHLRRPRTKWQRVLPGWHPGALRHADRCGGAALS